MLIWREAGLASPLVVPKVVLAHAHVFLCAKPILSVREQTESRQRLGDLPGMLAWL